MDKNIRWVPVRCPVCGKRLAEVPEGTAVPLIRVYCKGKECRTVRILGGGVRYSDPIRNL